MDNAQYEALAEIHEASPRIPIRRCDTFNFLAAIEPIQGTRVLYLTTGPRFFARKMTSLGTSHITGVEVSQVMLDAAG